MNMNKAIKLFAILILALFAVIQAANAQEVIFTSDAILNISPDAKLIFNNGANLINNSNTTQLNGKFVFNGPDETGIGGTQSSVLEDLTLENSAIVNLSSNISIGKNLNLTLGILKLLNSNLNLLSGASINGSFSENNMIVADGNGKLSSSITATGIYDFPVGDLTATADYSPVKITINSGNFNNAVLSVNLKDAKHPANTSTTHYLSRYWTVNQTGITNLHCNVEFHFVNEDINGNEADIYGGKWNGTYWVPLDKVSLNAVTGIVGDLYDFTAGELSVLNVEVPFEENIEIVVEGNSISIRLLEELGLESLEIFNSLGQKVLFRNINNSDYYQLDINTGKGVYLIKISGNGKSMSKKVAIY